MNLTANDLKKGVIFSCNQQLYQVLEYQQKVMARQSSTVTVKARNLQTGKFWQHTFTGSEDIKAVDFSKMSVQFLYRDGANFYFMDLNDFEQYMLSIEIIADKSLYLIENQTVTLYLHDGQPLLVELPKNVWLTVKSTPQITKGDTANDVTKEAEMETGLKVRVPAFIKTGDIISVDTTSGSYRERQK